MEKKPVLIKLVAALVALGIASGVAVLIYMLVPAAPVPAEEWTTPHPTTTAVLKTKAPAPKRYVRDNVENFAFYLYRTIDKTNEKNVVFSPVSIYSALSFIGKGVGRNTLQQIEGALFTTDLSNIEPFIVKTFRNNKLYNISLAQRIFIDSSIKLRKPFENFTQQNGLSAVRRMDFSANPKSCRIEINDWVENNTLGQIKDILSEDQVTADSRIYVVNALALEVSWQSSRNDSMRTFWVSEDKQIQTDMIKILDWGWNLRITHELTKYRIFRNTTVVVLPLRGRKVECVIVMPNKIGDFPEIDNQAGQAKLLKLIKNPRFGGCHVYMPKFTLDYKYVNLKEDMKKMGIKDIFDENLADFSRLYEGDQPLYVKDVVHKATFRLDEKGVNALALDSEIDSTADKDARPDRSYSPQANQKTIYIDKPFLFLVRHKDSGALLFMGKVVDPRKS